MINFVRRFRDLCKVKDELCRNFNFRHFFTYCLYDEVKSEMLYKNYINVSVVVDTEWNTNN